MLKKIKFIIALTCTAFLFMPVSSLAYSNNENAIVIDEKPGTTQEMDLTNLPLDSYLNALQDDELR